MTQIRTFEAGDAKVVVDARQGGRLVSLEIFGQELLVTDGDTPLHFGCYPMAPWVGRLRHGRFRFEGRDYELPLNMPPHAIHGTVLDREWSWDGGRSLSVALGADWPFAGRALQALELEPDRLTLELEVQAEAAAFPASIGWHPWFRRQLGIGAAAELDFAAAAMYERDADDIPTGAVRTPTARPWDDCFRDVRSGPSLHWPGALRLKLLSSADHWVVYDQPQHAICVEPQTGPANALNLVPSLVTREQSLRANFTLAWSRDS